MASNLYITTTTSNISFLQFSKFLQYILVQLCEGTIDDSIFFTLLFIVPGCNELQEGGYMYLITFVCPYVAHLQ